MTEVSYATETCLIRGTGKVIVIGATNRIDSIDPALRRPGRFDREFLFPLPAKDARKYFYMLLTLIFQGNSGNSHKELGSPSSSQSCNTASRVYSRVLWR